MDGFIATSLGHDGCDLPSSVTQHIMQTAIHGFAVTLNMPEKGVPAMPERQNWLPVFIRLMHHHDWRLRVEALTTAGLIADQAPDEITASIRRTILQPGVKHSLVDQLAIMAG